MGVLSALRSGGSLAEASPSSNSIPDAISLARSMTGLETNDSCFPTMSYETRIKGFAFSFVLGWILGIISVVAISFGNIPGFAVLYSFGNIITVFATMFLVGPWRQMKNMLDRTRIIATCVFFGMLIATLVVGLTTHNFILVLICVVFQFAASVWYSISYIPFARDALCSCIKPALGLNNTVSVV